MKPQDSERALRSIVAALLNSGLPAADVRETATLLTSDSDFAERFIAILDAVLRHLPPPEPRSRPEQSNGAASSRSRASRAGGSDVDEVMRILDSIRITKKELVAQLQSHRALADWQPSPHWSRRQIIESVVKNVPRSMLPDVLATITVGRGPTDPWMEALAARASEGNGRR